MPIKLWNLRSAVYRNKLYLVIRARAEAKWNSKRNKVTITRKAFTGCGPARWQPESNMARDSTDEQDWAASSFASSNETCNDDPQDKVKILNLWQRAECFRIAEV